MPPTSKPGRSRALLVGCAIALGLFLVAETALRLFGFENRVTRAPMLVWNAGEDELMASGAYLYQMDAHSLWSPRPGAVIQFGELERIDGPPELVNEDGLRGPRLPRAKTPGVLRIATLGDSSTFGLAVHHPETYAAQLVLELEKRGVRAEVLSAGVEGFTITQGLERYRHLVRAWKPDVVIAAFGAVNEHWSADETDEEKVQRLAEQRSTLLRASTWLRDHVRVVQGLAWLRDPKANERFLKEADKKRAVQQFLAQYAGDTQWPFDRRVPIDDFKRLTAELVREVRADGARPILVAMPRKVAAEEAFPVLRLYTRSVLEVAAAEEAQILFAHARFRFVEKAGEPHPWFIHDFWHPNAEGHRKFAEWLAPLVVDPNLALGRDLEVEELKKKAKK